MAAFDADAIARERAADYKPWPFKWQGQRYELPNLSTLSVNEAVELQEAMTRASTQPDPEDSEDVANALFALLDLLDTIAGAEAADALRDMPSYVMARLLTEWEASAMEDMGELGKEDSPPSPRNRQERRSKQTSPPKARTSGPSRSTKSAATSSA